jgi:hypothetical protein|nr:MAG TPA: hypothetical protein [Caudoviricetes sp.]
MEIIVQKIVDRDLMNSAGAGLRQYKRQPNILTYGMNTRNKTRIVYEGEDWMRVLFVRPSIYDTVCDWYERMDTVQKHRKETAICKSPEDFWDIFDKDKFGVQYTTFYFDDMLTLTDTLECFKEIARLYGEEDAKYISENKMRRITMNYLMNNNQFDLFQQFSITPECLDDVIHDALADQQCECVCRPLL